VIWWHPLLAAWTGFAWFFSIRAAVLYWRYPTIGKRPDQPWPKFRLFHPRGWFSITPMAKSETPPEHQSALLHGGVATLRPLRVVPESEQQWEIHLQPKLDAPHERQ
jgi:hypothetical protein